MLHRNISTHALTWSATLVVLVTLIVYQQFQLTRSRGARREGLLDEIIDQLDFNSRAHVERDSFVRHLRVYFLVISTHALTWSATKNWRKSQWKKSISTHALTWSATGGGKS